VVLVESKWGWMGVFIHRVNDRVTVSRTRITAVPAGTPVDRLDDSAQSSPID